MKHLIIFIVLSIATMPHIAAQTRLTGKVVNKDSMPNVGAIMKLLKPDSSTIVRFTTSDASGLWDIDVPKTGEYLLSVSCIVCENWLQKVAIKQGDSLNIPIVLNEKTFDLDVLEVKNKRILIKQRGDTLIYNIEGFKNGMEDNIGDLLKNLPGLEVDTEGSIKYKGKRVNKLLLEDKDIFNSMHKIFSEGINAKDVKSVQIIENYKESKDAEIGNKTEKTALNVELTDDAKKRLNGNTTLAAGYKNRYDFGLNAYKANESVGLSLFAKANNTGQTLMSAADYLGLQTSLFRVFQGLKVSSQGGMDDVLPEALRMPYNLVTNKDQLIFGSLDKKINKNVSLKFAPILLNAHHVSENVFSRQYLASLVNFSGNNKETVKAQLLNVNNNVKWTINKNSTVELDLPINYLNSDKNTFKTGRFGQDLMSNTIALKTKNTSIAPNLTWKYTLNDSLNVGVSAEHFYNRKGNDYDVADINNLFSARSNSIVQNTVKETNASHVELSLKHKLTKLNYGVKFMLDNAHDYLSVNTDLIPSYFWNGQNTLHNRTTGLEAVVSYKSGKWEFENRGDIKRVASDFKAEGSEDFTLVNNTAKISYKGNFGNQLSINVSNRQSLQNIESLSNLYLVSDSRNLATGGLRFNDITTARSLLLVYQNQDVSNGNLFFSNLSYTVSENVLGSYIENKENAFLMQSILLPQTKTLSVNTYLTRKLQKLNLFFFQTCLLNIVKGVVYSDAKFQPTSLTTFNSNTNVDYTKVKKFKFGVGADINLTQQSALNSLLNAKYFSLSFYIQGTIDGKLLKFKSKFSYNYQTNFSVSNGLPNLDFSLESKEIVKKMSLILTGRNVLSLNGQKGLKGNFTPNYIEIEQYSMFSGYVTIGLKYNFN